MWQRRPCPHHCNLQGKVFNACNDASAALLTIAKEDLEHGHDRNCANGKPEYITLSADCNLIIANIIKGVDQWEQLASC